MFKISAEPLQAATLQRSLADAHAGACVTFTGWVRDHNDGRKVTALEYEAYAPLAGKEGNRILAAARGKFALRAAKAVHRVGRLRIGGIAVWVGVTAEHRGPAFAACRYIIDEIKARVPIWKKEHYTGGATTWINCATAGRQKVHQARQKRTQVRH